jgi:hypothetical protein
VVTGKWLDYDFHYGLWYKIPLTIVIICYIYIYLVGGLEHELYDFPYIGNVITPTDELTFFRGVGIPPWLYQQELGFNLKQG